MSLLLASPFALTQRGKKQLFASYNFFFLIEYAVSLVERIFLLKKKEKKEKKKQH